jgi:hypothetical protein
MKSKRGKDFVPIVALKVILWNNTKRRSKIG